MLGLNNTRSSHIKATSNGQTNSTPATIYKRTIKAFAVFVPVLWLSACTDKNEHFCSKYQYYHNELTAPGILPLRDIRQQLQDELAKKTKAGHNTEKTRTMLLVLDDLQKELITDGLEPREFCMKRKRWNKI